MVENFLDKYFPLENLSWKKLLDLIKEGFINFKR